MRVAVTDPGPTTNAQTGLSLARALRGTGIPCVGLAFTPFAPGIYDGAAHGLEAIYRVRAPYDEFEAFARALTALPAGTVLLPGSPRVAAAVAGRGLTAAVASPEALRSCDPSRVRGPVRPAEGALATDAAQIALHGRRLGWPLVLRPLGDGYAAAPALVYGPAEAWKVARGLFAAGVPALWVRERTEGEPTSVGLVRAPSGRLLAAGAVRRLYGERGATWMETTVRATDLIGAAAAIAEAHGLTGPVEVEFATRPHADPVVTDIYPSLPAWTDLAAEAGVNLARAACRLALGEEIPEAGEFRAGLLATRYAWDVVTTLERVGEALGEGLPLSHRERAAASDSEPPGEGVPSERSRRNRDGEE